MKLGLANILLAILALNTLWFVAYSGHLGLQGLTQDLSAESRLWHPDAPIATAVLFAHMLLGAVLTVGAPVQAMPVVRARAAGFHRRFGYVLATLAVLTGLGGLAYIAARGTVGGWWMSVAFAVYGALLILAAANTIYHAIDKNRAQHTRWAARLVILAVGSWIYRMHYGLWSLSVGEAGMTDSFTGPFDRITVWAFFVPYLLVAEAVFWRNDRRRARLARAPTGA